MKIALIILVLAGVCSWLWSLANDFRIEMHHHAKVSEACNQAGGILRATPSTNDPAPCVDVRGKTIRLN